jgi:hypothetical protein
VIGWQVVWLDNEWRMSNEGLMANSHETIGQHR